ncbi:hypothetical protein L6452_05894 [Arctium lappa]|uniref:Uncharacterized protein n=1 Tax=Arctium lappa TaxID=4217 RepID=A0ACB9EH76_ARCLA|nr:hypothetical protein L6452_05894 [Arctium lappa]
MNDGGTIVRWSTPVDCGVSFSLEVKRESIIEPHGSERTSKNRRISLKSNSVFDLKLRFDHSEFESTVLEIHLRGYNGCGVFTVFVVVVERKASRYKTSQWVLKEFINI